MKKVKKGKIPVVITLAISCFALVTIMFIYFNVVEQTDITSIETMREDELKSELADWKKRYNEANQQYEEKVAKLNEYKEKEQSSADSAKLVQKELEQTNIYLGKTDVTGQGITIKIQDTADATINAQDILIIVDYLKSAGAEAISVNGNRIINMSDIVDINYETSSIVYINQERVTSPYTINAIGDSTKLKSTLLGNGGYIDILKNEGFENNITIEESKSLVIPKYNKDFGYKYMK